MVNVFPQNRRCNILINDRFKLIYKLLDEETILIFAVWDMKQDPNKLKLFI